MQYPNIQQMNDEGAINVGQDILDNIVLGLFAGSMSYGTKMAGSDIDVFCVTVPSKEQLYPYSHGYIYGFGPRPNVFESYQNVGLETDISIWSIVKFFNIASKGGPNVIDVLFAPEDCIWRISPVGRKILDNKNLFLSKEVALKFLGMSNCVKRGGDRKSRSHSLRARFAARNILRYHDYKTDGHALLVKSVKKGTEFFDYERIMKELEEEIKELMRSSTLRDKCDLSVIQCLLKECLDLHYEK